MSIGTANILFGTLPSSDFVWTRISGDAFYYLVYGQALSDGNPFYINGVGPTSGFHPLYVGIVAFAMQLGDFFDLPEYVFLRLFSAAFFLLGCYLIYRIVLDLGAGNVGALCAVLFYAYAGGIGWVPEVFDYGFNSHVWGMETDVHIPLVLTSLWVGIRILKHRTYPGYTNIAVLGITSSLTILARLDSFLYIGLLPAFVVLLKNCTCNRKNMSTLKLMVFGTLIALSLPLIYSAILFVCTGIFVPTSGAVKSSFPYANFGQIPSSLIDLYPVVRWYICIVICNVIIMTFGWSKHRATSLLLTATNISLILFGIWHLFFTYKGHIGSWYWEILPPLLFIQFIHAASILVQRIRAKFNTNLLNEKLLVVLLCGTLFIGGGIVFMSHISFLQEKDSPFHIDRAVYLVSQQAKHNLPEKDTVFFDGTDGSFMFFSDFESYHRGGMANTPDYATFAKMIRDASALAEVQLFDEYFTEKAITHVVIYSAGQISALNTLCQDRVTTTFDELVVREDRFVLAQIYRSDDYLDYLACVATEKELESV